MGKVKRKVQKLIPKEIKPFVAPLAAMYLGPMAAGALGPGVAGSAAGRFFTNALVNAAAQKAVNNDIDPLSAAFSGAAGAAGAGYTGTAGYDPKTMGLGSLANTAEGVPDAVAGKPGFFDKAITKTDKFINPDSLTGTAKLIAAQEAIPGAQRLKQINEDELAKYNAQLLEQGIGNKTARRKGIYDIYAGIQDDNDERVYSDEYINSMLDQYSYAKGGKVDKPVVPADELAKILEEFMKQQDKQEEIRRQNKADGGRVGLEAGGDPEKAALVQEVKRLRDELDDEKTTKGIQSGMEYATKGFEQALGGPLGGAVAKPMRIIPGFARGGITDIDVNETMTEEPDNTMMASRIDYDDVAQSLFQEYLDMGMTPDQAAAAVRDYLDSSKMGLKNGGNVSMTDDNSGVIYHDEKGKPISKSKAMELFNKQAEEEYRNKKAEGGIMNASRIDTDDVAQSLFQEYLDMGMTPDQAASAVRDYLDSSTMGLKDGGKVIPIMPKGVFYKGKAKDYPGVSKAMKDALKKRREKKAEGGLLGLKMGGVPAELDYRGGGMIQVGSKEKADDVPARLSKNEFVMTADAVKGAGGGDPRRGAERMYQMMDQFEAKV